MSCAVTGVLTATANPNGGGITGPITINDKDGTQGGSGPVITCSKDSTGFMYKIIINDNNSNECSIEVNTPSYSSKQSKGKFEDVQFISDLYTCTFYDGNSLSLRSQ